MTNKLFGLPITDCRITTAVGLILDAAAAGSKLHVFFVNAHCINIAARDREYLERLRRAPLLFADGAGMEIAARLAGQPLKDNVNGTDLLPLLCQTAAERGVRLAFVGAAPGIAETCAGRMKERYPGLEIAYVHDGYFKHDDAQRIAGEIQDSGGEVVLVGQGVPLQERTIETLTNLTRAPVFVGVGGLFDFYSGRRARAPRWLRAVRLEWVYRLAQEPGRLFGRYILGNPLFLIRSLLLRMRGRQVLKETL